MTAWAVKCFRIDKRRKDGERLVDTLTMELDTKPELVAPKGWRLEVVPATRTVTNLMTGQPVEIAHDTPWCCNPASESYWSN